MNEERRGLVLVVAGEPSVRTRIANELRGAQHRVVESKNVVEAVAELHGLEFDVVLVELGLAPRGAIDLLRVARELSPSSQVAVMLDDDVDVSTVIRCARMGAFDFVRSADDTSEVLTVVARGVAQRSLHAARAISDASEAILDGADTRRLPRLIVELGFDALSAETACLVSHDGAGRPYIAELRGEPCEKDVLDIAVWAAARSIHGATALPDETRPVHDWPATTRARAAIVCPMIVEERVHAFFVVVRTADPRPFRRADVEHAGVLASQIRLALENAELVKKTAAAQRMAVVGELAAGVAHEIKNPVTYVLTNAELATESLDPLRRGSPELEEVAQMLLEVKEGAERIRDIVQDLQTLSRAKGVVHPFDINDAVRSALRVVGARMRGQLHLRTDLAAHSIVDGNVGRLSQVLVNLFTNAADAAASSNMQADLVVRTRVVGDRVVVTVDDTGPGIAPDHLSRMFEPFFTTKGEAGLGLGMSIVRDIVVDHGGTIDVTSELGKGTSIVVSLPVSRTVENENERSESRPLRLLFVDREWTQLRRYEAWFGADHDVACVENAKEALRIVEEGYEPDVAICEERADAAAAQALEALERAGCTVIGKPFELATLRAAVHACASTSSRAA